MAGPWEKYKKEPAQSQGPWSKYQAPAPAEPSFSDKAKAAVKPLADLLEGASHSDPKLGIARLMLNGTAGKVLDYPAGLVRTAAFYGPNDEKNVVAPEDWQNTLKGQAPKIDEYLKRSGVGEGPSTDIIPGLGHVTTRGALSGLASIFTDPLTYTGLGLENRIAGPAVESAGKGMYKSGLKRIDQEVAKYGKEPVSDVLMKYGITGSADSISKQMDDLGQTLLQKQKNILKNATSQGAEVDMNNAVGKAQSLVDDMKKIDHPEMRDAVNALQNRIDTYKARNAKNGEDVLRELPFTKEQETFVQKPEVTGYDATKEMTENQIPQNIGQTTPGTFYTEPVKDKIDMSTLGTGAPARYTVDRSRIGNVINNPTDQVMSFPVQGETKNVLTPDLATIFDQSERIPGPTPIQTNAWKSTNNVDLPDSIYRKLQSSGRGKQFDKALNGGIRDATEESIGKAIGPEAQEKFHTTNDELGRVLTSQDKADIEAAKEMNKNAVTSVDAPLAVHSPTMFLAKKVADIAKMTGPRTMGGQGLMKVGNTELPDSILRRMYINNITGNELPALNPYLGGNQ